jgi:hypothetical protein
MFKHCLLQLQRKLLQHLRRLQPQHQPFRLPHQWLSRRKSLWTSTWDSLNASRLMDPLTLRFLHPTLAMSTNSRHRK